MTEETRIAQLTETLRGLAQLGGKGERTRIVTNLEVIDATGGAAGGSYIIIEDENGFYTPALRVPGVNYSDGDLVNVLYITGTEAIAFMQGSGSPAPGYSDRIVSPDGGDTLIIDNAGDVTLTGRDLILPDDIVHSGDPDTLISFTANQIELLAGNVSAIYDGDFATAAGQDVLLTGGAAPQSQIQHGVLAQIGHILDGGHFANPYPTSPNADNAEFNNTTQADNDTIGTHAGGDFWEWSSGDPSAGSGSYSINTTFASHLYVVVNFADSDAVLAADTAAITASTLIDFEMSPRNIFPFSTTSDEYVAIRVTDSATSNYWEVFLRNDATGPLMQVGSAYVDGGARTVYFTETFADRFGLDLLRIKWRQQANNKYRLLVAINNLIQNFLGTAYTFVNTYAPDTVELIFGKSDDASQSRNVYEIDSFRRSQ